VRARITPHAAPGRIRVGEHSRRLPSSTAIIFDKLLNFHEGRNDYASQIELALVQIPMASPTASSAFAVPLQVLVVDDRDGVQHSWTLQLRSRAPAATPGRPSSADLTLLHPLMRALGDALATQEEGLDPERLSRTYEALMAELHEVAGMGVKAVELTPATLSPVLPEDEEEDEEDEEEGVRTRRTRRATAKWLSKKKSALHGDPRPDILSSWSRQLSLPIPCHVHWHRSYCQSRARTAAI